MLAALGFVKNLAETVRAIVAAGVGAVVATSVSVSSSGGLTASNPTFTGMTCSGASLPFVLDTATSEANFNSVTPATSQTDYAIAGSQALMTRFMRYRVGGGAAITLNSITAPPGGYRLGFWICNVNTNTAHTITLLHDDGATGTAAMRFLCPNNASVVIRANGAVFVWYDTTDSRWRVHAP